MRSTREVIDDHLRRRAEGDLEGDLAANYAEGVLVLSKDGAFHGHDGVRQAAGILEAQLPQARFSYDLVRVAEDVALLGWSGEACDGARTCHGVDSFVVRGGRIAVQTIHFDVRREQAPP